MSPQQVKGFLLDKQSEGTLYHDANKCYHRDPQTIRQFVFARMRDGCRRWWYDTLTIHSHTGFVLQIAYNRVNEADMANEPVRANEPNRAIVYNRVDASLTGPMRLTGPTKMTGSTVLCRQTSQHRHETNDVDRKSQ